MAQIPDSVRVTGLIAPSDDTDTYPSHHAKWGRGGHRTVDNLTERNLISNDRREEGMLCYVKDTGGGSPGMYQLVGGITNGDWVPVSFGGGGEWIQSTDPGPPSQDFLRPTDGDTRKVSIGTVTNAPTAGVAGASAMFRVENGNIEIMGINAGEYNGPHLVMAGWHFWVDATTGNFYVKNGVPSGPTDGSIVGTQS